MSLNLLLIFGPDSLHRVLLEQGIDQVLAVIGSFDFRVIEEKLAIDDILEHSLVISVVERRRAIDHLEDQDTKSPPVSHEGLALVCNDFRTYIQAYLLT